MTNMSFGNSVKHGERQLLKVGVENSSRSHKYVEGR